MQAQPAHSGVESLRQFVLDRRHELGLRQKDLAERSGLSLGWVGMLEAKRLKHPPRRDTLLKLAEGLNRPGEAIDDLGQVLQLIVQGVMPCDMALAVAFGKVHPSLAIARALEVAGIEVVDAVGAGGDPALLFDRRLRPERFARVVALLEVDLGEEDVRLVEKLLRRLYDSTPIEAPLPQAAPRRRNSRPSGVV